MVHIVEGYMCGFFMAASEETCFKRRVFDRLNFINETIDPRGPDARSYYEQEGLFAIHTHLRITGFQAQPLLYNSGVIIYNGEIYNEWKNSLNDPNYSDAKTLQEVITGGGINALEDLDGEFAIAIYDSLAKTVTICTDTFGTKPVYYSARPGEVVVGSYDATIRAFDEGLRSFRVPANTLLVLDVETGTLISRRSLFKFDFSRQIAQDYDQCLHFLDLSLRKRTANSSIRYFVPLSGGHDSGFIAANLMDKGVHYECYSVPYLEDRDVLLKRIEILAANQIRTNVMELKAEEVQRMRLLLHEKLSIYRLIAPDFEEGNFPDPDFRNVPGFIATAIICERAKREGRKVQLSGQGSDEILTDYSTGSMRMSELKGNWTGLNKPWKNLMSGWNAVFLGASERIAGLFGIETRYPFLDRDLVQAFINLTPKLKSAKYKGPISDYFDKIKFPYTDKKQGFAGYVSRL